MKINISSDHFLRKKSDYKELIKIMKICLLFLFAFTFQLMALNTNAQDAVIELKTSSVTIGQLINEIERQTNYLIVYSNREVDTNRKVNFPQNSDKVSSYLSTAFSNTDIGYNFENDYIILSKKAHQNTLDINRLIEASQQQRKTVTGTVTDENGDPVIGATIVEKNNPSHGTVSDVDGNFTVTNIPENAILQFTYVGMKTQEMAVKGQTTIHIIMEPDVELLDELIVVGYGVQKRSDVTGAIASVTAEKLNATPSTSLGEMLRGAAPGIQVTMGSAAPGGSSNILVRGRRSLSAGNDPLYIVDGVPSPSIDDINANDIASLEILKDASSQSIYGARAANGVILITTKRGMAGKTKVSVNTYAGVQNLYRNFEFYDGEQWAAYRKEAFYNAYGYYNEDEAFKGVMRDVLHSKKYVDWEDVMLSPAWQNKNDVLIQAGNEKTKYALSLGHFFQDGIVPSSNFQRFTGRLNVDQKLSEKISLGANISYTKSFRKIADGSFNSFITMPPLAEVYKEDGSLREDVTEAGESHYNPLWNNRNSENVNITDRLNLNVVGDWKILKNLSYRLNTNLNKRDVQENSYLGINHTTGRNNGGRAIVGQSTYTDYLVENILNYSKDIHKHHLDATAVASLNGIQWKRISNTGFGFANDDLSYHAIASATTHSVPVYEFSDRKLLSYMARARYNYDSRYLLTLAIRVDGSSVFGANNKYGYFPSAAFAWRASQEEFLKDVGFLSDLKVRVSYGQVGNQAISPYTTLGLADKYLTEFGDEIHVGYLPNAELTNPNLKWETSTSANLGLDYSLFKGRINGTIELYDTQTTDLLVSRSLPTTSGYSSQLVNLGHVQNKGFELALNVIPIDKKDFQWEVGVNFTVNRNKIKKIDGKLDADGNQANDLNNRWFIGESMNVYYDYQFDGIWQLTDDIANSHMPEATPGSVRVKDVNGDGVISVDDRVVIQRDPKFITSFVTGFDYKNFNLSFDFYYLNGGYFYNPYLATFENGGDLTGKRNGLRRNYWTIHNPSNEAPAPNFIQMPAYLSSLAYEKADYIRLRTVSLSYNVSQKNCRKIGIESLKLFSTMSNVWTLTDVQGYGPEQNPGQYPEPRTLLFGLNFSF